ncbi:MAG: hypothetical protein MUD01_07410 [Chloroflexaceae bacterium]|jgi:hypothetical protein|nr:hypothetical protein [Chloroflexaceae bacterium]
MSSDLHIRFNQTVELARLATATGSALGELLNLAVLPPVQIAAWQQMVALPAKQTHLEQEPQAWLLTLEGRVEGIVVELFEVPHHPKVPPGESGNWIAVAPSRMSLAYALAAAAAIALAQFNQTMVIDDGELWTRVAEQTPEAMLSALRLPDRPRSLDEAGELFCTRMARGQDS